MLPRFDHLDSIPDSWSPGGRQAAVVMLFVCRDEHPAQVVLTRRSTSVSTHKGQIGFPGGRAEPYDQGPGETALRELEEELGVPASEVKLHGMIRPAHALDRSAVVAVVGSTRFPVSRFVPSPSEVAEVILTPWPSLTPEKSQPFKFNMFGVWRESHLYEVEANRVWGLTAYLIHSAQLST